jgi:toxin YoeB
MEIEYTLKAKADLAYWKKINNIIVLKKIRKLIESILETPFIGIGKPEQLKHELTGCWSRRIDKKHRVVYELVEEEKILIYSLRGHYI